MPHSSSSLDTLPRHTLEVRLGRLRLPLRTWLKYSTQTRWIFEAIASDRSDDSGLSVEIYDQNRLLAKGELVHVEGRLAVRIDQRFPL